MEVLVRGDQKLVAVPLRSIEQVAVGQAKPPALERGVHRVTRVPSGDRRLTLADLGLDMVARRDRAAVGGAREQWSAAPTDAGDWRNVSGRRSRKLLRDMDHMPPTALSRPGPVSPAPWAGRSSNSPRRYAPRATSGTSAGCAPSTPTPSASGAEAP